MVLLYRIWKQLAKVNCKKSTFFFVHSTIKKPQILHELNRGIASVLIVITIGFYGVKIFGKGYGVNLSLRTCNPFFHSDLVIQGVFTTGPTRLSGWTCSPLSFEKDLAVEYDKRCLH